MICQINYKFIEIESFGVKLLSVKIKAKTIKRIKNYIKIVKSLKIESKLKIITVKSGRTQL